MTKTQRNMAAFLGGYKKAAVKQLRELQVTQSFGGSLKIKADRVYVDRRDGRRALEHLRALKAMRLAKAE